jgi:hypothetical protein
LIQNEYKKGRPFEELVRYITPENLPDDISRSKLLSHLIQIKWKNHGKN